MAVNHEHSERLHEQASALYLQGDYMDALAVWQRILAANPADERAKEGVRLCELLDPEDGAAIPPAEPSASSPNAVALGEETERTLEQLDEALGSSGTDWMDAAPVAPASSEPATPLFPVDEPESMDIDAPVRLDLDSLVLPVEDVPVEATKTDARGSQTAAAELDRRAAELMSEAMQLYERGEREEALAALHRLAILDESNEAALTFAAHIRSEIESTETRREMLGGASFVQPDPPTPFPPPPAPSSASPRPGTVSVAFHEDPTESEPDLVEVGLDSEPFEDAASAREGRTTKAKLDVPAPRRLPPRWLLVCAGALVVGITGYFLLRSDGGDATEPSGTPTADAPQRAGLGAGARSARKSKPPGDDASEEGSTPAVAAPAEDLDTLLTRGRAAFEAGDYKAAVLAYDQALVVDPTNGEARSRLIEAGDRYRGQKAVEDSRAAALDSYARGDYVDALRLFYRLTPQDPEDEKRINRYLRNGWYNLGIGALRTGDCKTAQSHFREAKQHDPTDEGVRRGLALAGKCSKATLTTEEYESVRTLTPRGLDD